MGNDRAFIAGFDIKEIASMQKAAQVTQVTMRIKHLMMGIEASKKPIIAGIRGSCFGGGLELILACHLRIATVGAEMGSTRDQSSDYPQFWWNRKAA